MAWAAMAAMAVSTVMTAVSQINEGRAAKQQAWHNASLMDRNAEIREQEGQQEFAASQRRAMIADREGRLRHSKALAAAAMGGGGISESAIQALSDILAEGHYNRSVALYEGKARQIGSENDAAMIRNEADATRISGSNAKRASVTRAASTVLKGASSMYSLYGGGGSAATGSYGTAGRASGMSPSGTMLRGRTGTLAGGV